MQNANANAGTMLLALILLMFIASAAFGQQKSIDFSPKTDTVFVLGFQPSQISISFCDARTSQTRIETTTTVFGASGANTEEAVRMVVRPSVSGGVITSNQNRLSRVAAQFTGTLRTAQSIKIIAPKGTVIEFKS